MPLFLKLGKRLHNFQWLGKAGDISLHGQAEKVINIMTNEKSITTEAELDAEWERVCSLTPQQLEAELLELGIDAIDLEADRRRFMQRLDGLCFAKPRSDYKM